MAKHIVCEPGDIPEGSCKAFMVEGKRIAVYNLDGEFFATQNHCTHKGAQLIHGCLEDGVIECSQHGWRFDVKSGKCLSPGHGRALRCFPVAVEGDGIAVELGADAARPKAAGVADPPGGSSGDIEYHAVASEDDLEDEEVIGVTVGGQEIALYRVDGEFYATQGLCSHEQVKLCDGFVEGDLIECPKHSACFEIRTGRAVNPPAEIDLQIYPIRREGKTILIGISSG